MAEAENSDPIPAATVVLLRNGDSGVEVLMLRKNAKIDFGGMWVFPGGCIEEEDYGSNRDINAAAQVAAARETREEAGIEADPESFIWFAHWTPPPITPRRFATWFFVTRAIGYETIRIDGDEIHDHCWVTPGDALERHQRQEFDLVAPTWVTLYYLSQYDSLDALLDRLASEPPKTYETHVGKTAEGHHVALWQGDAGYEAWDAQLEGERHRLIMAKGSHIFENTIERY